jgi:hypothetical protein
MRHAVLGSKSHRFHQDSIRATWWQHNCRPVLYQGTHKHGSAEWETIPGPDWRKYDIKGSPCLHFVITASHHRTQEEGSLRFGVLLFFVGFAFSYNIGVRILIQETDTRERVSSLPISISLQLLSSSNQASLQPGRLNMHGILYSDAVRVLPASKVPSGPQTPNPSCV